jgi:hypothetical protein
MHFKFRPALPILMVVAGLTVPSAASAAWEEKAVSLPSGGVEGVLWGGISCFSANSCTATGSYQNGTIWGALGYEWKGTSWSLAPVVYNPGDKDAKLNSVDCFTSTKCWAVGSYGASGTQKVLSERSISGAWNAVSVPGSKVPQAYGVSCTNASGEERCIAVGQWNQLFVGGAIMALGWDGAKWTEIPITTNPGGGSGGILWSVDCTSPNACRAVGGWGTSSGKVVPGEQFWNGSSWTFSAVPGIGGSNYGMLRGISCVAANYCIAVGNFKNYEGRTVAIAHLWNGASWSIIPLLVPEGATSSELLGVSCTAANSCRAVGTYKNSFGTSRTLASRWNGSGWTLETTPNPVGSTASAWQGISCTGIEECQAVGWYTNASGWRLPLAAHL